MNDLEIKADAMLAELSQQLSMLSGRAAALAGELALAKGKIKQLEDMIAAAPNRSVTP